MIPKDQGEGQVNFHPEQSTERNADRLLLGQFLRRVPVGSTFHKLSGAGQLASGNHSQVFNLLTEKDAKFRENQPRILVLSVDRK